MIRSPFASLRPLLKESRKRLLILRVLLLLLIVGAAVPRSISYAQGVPDEEISFHVILAGFSDKWGTNDTFFIKTQQQLDRIIEEMVESEYVPFFHDLLPIPSERIDFLPIVDFSHETVIAIVGRKHDSPCRATKVTQVKRDALNALTVDLEETLPESCGIDKLAAQANPIILIKVSGVVSGLKSLRESVKVSLER